jgi:hypothetical protein
VSDARLLRELIDGQQRVLAELAGLHALMLAVMPRAWSRTVPVPVDAVLAVLVTTECARAFGAGEAFERAEAALTSLGVKNAKSLGRRLGARVGISVGDLQLRIVGMQRGAKIWCFIRVSAALTPANPQ